jgi:hypothetical protein
MATQRHRARVALFLLSIKSIKSIKSMKSLVMFTAISMAMLTVMLMVVLSACSPARRPGTQAIGAPPPKAEVEGPPTDTLGAAIRRGDGVPAQSSEQTVRGSAAQPVQTGSTAPAGAEKAAGAQAQALGPQPAGQGQQPWDRMIIRNATVNLVADNVGATLDALTGIVTSTPGAYIFGSNIRFENNRQVATITLRVPGPAFDEVMGRIRRLAAKPEDVTNEQVASQDVTEEFVDLQSQVRNLQAQEQRLLQLLERAQNVQEILLVQQRLSETRAQIERLQGRMNFLERRAEFGTITVTITARPQEPKQDQPKGWDPQRTFQRAWASLAVILQAMADAAIWLAVWSVILVPVAAILALLLWVVRRLARPIAPPAVPPAPAA